MQKQITLDQLQGPAFTGISHRHQAGVTSIILSQVSLMKLIMHPSDTLSRDIH